MRIAVVVSFALALAGCAVVPPSAWTFDPAQPRAKATVAPGAFAALSERVATLQARRQEIQDRIAGEADTRQRVGEYERLHAVGMQLAPLQRELASVTPAP